MTSPMTVAIIPVRFIPSTKHRLSQSMDADTRHQLVRAMLVDVIKAVTSARRIDQFIIVTSDEDFLANVTDTQFELHRSKVSGLNEELMEIIEILEQRDVTKVIIIFADLPLLSGAVLDELVSFSQKTSRPIIAQDWTGAGTNLLCFDLPCNFHFHFGENSFQLHEESFQKAGLEPIIYHAIETALDIDNQQAITQLIALAYLNKSLQKTNTFRVLQVDEKRKGKAT